MSRDSCSIRRKKFYCNIDCSLVKNILQQNGSLQLERRYYTCKTVYMFFLKATIKEKNFKDTINIKFHRFSSTIIDLTFVRNKSVNRSLYTFSDVKPFTYSYLYKALQPCTCSRQDIFGRHCVQCLFSEYYSVHFL